MMELKIFTGNGNPELARRMCEHLGVSIGDAQVEQFPDGEINVRINEDVRGRDIFIVQPTCPPVNHNLVELLIMVDAARRSSAGRITAVIPYYGYARKDKKEEGRVPITAKLVANMLSQAGVDRVLTMDLHATQIQGFFDIPVDHLFSFPVLSRYFKKLNIPDLVVATPDVGGIRMARAFSSWLEAGLAVVDKRRISPEEAETGFVIGEVAGRLGTGAFLVGALAGTTPPWMLPMIVFGLSAMVSFATGSSWSTMAVLLPASVPLAFHVGGVPLMAVSLGAVLDGSIFGDHCSPLSDTTILSSISAGCDHIDHVRTQLPYALTVALAAVALGYLEATWLNPLFSYLLALTALGIFLRFVGRKS